MAFSSDELQALLADGADLRPAAKSKSRDPRSQPGDVTEEVLSKPGRAFRMQNVSIRRAGDLPAFVRAAVEQLLGRAIAADEEVSVSAVPPQQGLPLADRKAVARQLEDFLDRRAGKVKDLPDEEMDLAIDEAAHHVRHSLK